MGLFTADKPKITAVELHKAVNSVPGLEMKERQYLIGLFQNELNESGQFKGIDREELEAEIANLHANRGMHPSLTDDEINRVEAALERML